jgi:ATP/maltotriose-dependent transcriptional regulator MalT
MLRHFAFGLSNKEIVEALKISIETIRNVQNILRKLTLADRTQVAVWATGCVLRAASLDQKHILSRWKWIRRIDVHIQ